MKEEIRGRGRDRWVERGLEREDLRESIRKKESYREDESYSHLER